MILLLSIPFYKDDLERFSIEWDRICLPYSTEGTCCLFPQAPCGAERAS